ncbi:MAG: lytic transglycosylase domain-containing protein [Bryobacteraceae bacterium]
MRVILIFALAAVAARAENPFAAIEARISRRLDETLMRAAAPAPPHAPAARAALEPAREPTGLAGILRSEGVPPELVAVAKVESGFRPDALSPKGARGMWQLMPETAERYGLRVSGARDERLDAVRSTQAAARYLRDLYGLFRAWPLALAAYNAGENTVLRAIERAGAREFAAIRSYLPLETRNYVPAVLAAMRGASNQAIGGRTAAWTF